MTRTTTDEIARAIKATLISPNVSDSNGESANLVDSTAHIAAAIFDLAEAVRELAKQDRGRE